MTRDWKTGKPIEEGQQIHNCWDDLILVDQFGITQVDWDTVVEQTTEYIRGWGEQDITGRISCMINLLMPRLEELWQGKKSGLSFRWLPCKSLQGATVADQALTASAIAYCLGYDNGFRCDVETLDKLRLSALTATWKEDRLESVYDALWSGASPIEPKPDGSEHERIVFLAQTAASKRKGIKEVQFNAHPLNQNKQIGLVLGGATKIKGYFLESAKLPEIRGASALLDRINLEYVPALFGRKPHDKNQSDRIRKEFSNRIGHTINAPECIIYAAGGNTLAFTPASIVHHVADEIERIYTKETLVANSVAAGDTFDLLELQYGLNPTHFWVEDFRKTCENKKNEELMTNYYGSTDDDFFNRKCFGELTTKLAQEQMRRREGNPASDRTSRRDLPTHVEIGPYQLRCESCERRPAIINNPRNICEACTRKYVVGRITKKENDKSREQGSISRYLGELSGWQPATEKENGGWYLNDWSSLFKNYLKATAKADQYFTEDQPFEGVGGPQDLEDIADASNPKGFITFVYADGNNMGGYLENIETPAQYRQFSERVFITLQKAAFDALAVYLKPNDDSVLPFEIISIGGDDLLLIVPGSAAFDVVHAIGKNFDQEFNSYSKFAEKSKLRKSQRYARSEWMDEQDMQPVFSLSLGFAIAEGHTPVGFLEHLAGSLLKTAKTRAKTLKKPDVGYLGGTVDFLVLKSLSMISSELGDFRKKFYKTDEQNVLTMRPFTLHELSGFIQTIQAFKKDGFPRSQLYQLRQSLELGRSTSTLDYLYFRSRLGDGKGKLLQEQIEHNWQSVSDSVNGQGPWYTIPLEHRTGKAEYETLLFDIIEAYDFIPEPEDQNEEDISDEFND